MSRRNRLHIIRREQDADRRAARAAEQLAAEQLAAEQLAAEQAAAAAAGKPAEQPAA